jgi:hypothetical protein
MCVFFLASAQGPLLLTFDIHHAYLSQSLPTCKTLRLAPLLAMSGESGTPDFCMAP